MTNIDWKSIKADNVETLRNTPWHYIDALVQLGLWDKFIEAFYDDALFHYATDALLKTKARKNVLKGATEDRIINLLDTVRPPIRRHLLNILIEESERNPLSIQIGENLFKNMDKHLWVYENHKEIFSLQPIETLRVAFRARIKPEHNKDPLQFFRLAINPKKSYDHKKDFLKSRFVNLQKDSFVQENYLEKRASFSIMLSDLLIEALNGYAKKKRGYLNLVLKPILDVFLDFSSLWRSNKTILAKVRESLLKFPYHLTKKSYLNLIFSSGTHGNFFRLGDFIKYKVISNEDFINTILPEALKHDFELPLDKARFVKPIISSLFNRYQNAQFYHVLHALDEKKKDHPLSFLWGKIISLGEQYYLNEFNNNNFEFLHCICSKLILSDYQSSLEFQHKFNVLPYDFTKGILIKIIRETIDHKEEIVKASPQMYSYRLKYIIDALLQNQNFKNDANIWKRAQTLPFYALPAELRDELISEYMCDPTGQKDYSIEITSDNPIIPLYIVLLLDDFKKVAVSLSKDKGSKSDQFGFQDKVKFAYPPSLSQSTRKAEEAIEKVHVFERYIFPLLRDKDNSKVNLGYQLYQSFDEKLLTAAIRLDNKDFYKLAIGTHLRLCRFLCSKVNANIQGAIFSQYCNVVAIPISIYAGLKSFKDYAQHLFDTSISNIPYTTEVLSNPLLQIFNVLIRSSYTKLLPEIDEVCAKLITLVLTRLFNEIPASLTKVDTSISSHFYETLNLPISEEKINAVKTVIDAQAQLVYPDKTLTILLKNLFDPKKSKKIDLSLTNEVNVDPAIITPEFVKLFEGNPKFWTGAQTFVETIEFLKKKVSEYTSEEYDRPSRPLLQFFIQFLKSNIYRPLSISRPIPVVPFDYEKTNSVSTYTANVNKWLTRSFIIDYSTACLVPALVPKDTFLYRLFTNPNFKYETLDELLVARLLNKAQEDEEKKITKKKKLHIQINAQISPIPDPAVVFRLKIHDKRPHPKPESCPKCGTKKPVKVKPLPTKVGHEEWIDVISWELIKPILQSDAKEFCNAVKNNGVSLFPIIKFLYIQLKKNSRAEGNINFVASLLDLCFKDILIEDPEPTEENKNPKPEPTLFMDEIGTITSSQISPFLKKAPKPGKPVQRRGRGKPKAPPKQSTVQTSGEEKFQATKVLIAYLSSILSYDIAKNNVDMTIFTKSLIGVLSLNPQDVKRKIGDDNYSLYTDHIAAALLNHISFGNEVKKLNWASKFESPVFESFFRLFACDATHHNALEWVNKLLQSLSRVDERNGIISSFVSALSEKSGPNYTLRTRTRTVAWCLDYHYVGNPIPKYCIDFIDSISQDQLLHVDVRRAIAAGSVAHFKWKALANGNTEQFEELFKILQKIYDTARVSSAPTFCQLIKPKYCKELATQSPIYKALMPETTLPETFITPQNFGKLKMPCTGEWKVPHQRFVSTFIGNSLLTKDENVIQLAIQVLTKLKIRGGEIAEKIAPFIINGFKEFNVHLPSAILINFMFNFCIQKPHSEIEGLVDGFVSMFSKLRKELDDTNNKQIQFYWTKDEKFRTDSYQAIDKLCGIFNDCIINRISEIVEKEDFKVAQDIAKRVVKELDGDKQVTIYFKPLDRLRRAFELVTNDNLIAALSAPAPTEETLRLLLVFLRETSLAKGVKYPYPYYVDTLVNKHANLLSIKLIEEELCNWPIEIGQDTRITNYLQSLFYSLITRIGKDNKDFIALLPRIWMLASLPFNSSSTNDVPASHDLKMMFSNSIQSQMGAPRIFGAMGVEREPF